MKKFKYWIPGIIWYIYITFLLFLDVGKISPLAYLTYWDVIWIPFIIVGFPFLLGKYSFKIMEE